MSTETVIAPAPGEEAGVGDVKKDRTADPIAAAVRDSAPGFVNLPPGSLLNMELSNLAFNERVLELVRDRSVPLLERVRFLSIFGGNLDEFFMTRVAGFKRQVALSNNKPTMDGIAPAEQLRLIDDRVRSLLERVYGTIIPELIKELRENGLEVVWWKHLTEDERSYVRAHYTTNLDAVMAPVFVRPGAPFPHVRNLRPAFIARVPNGTRESNGQYAIVELPGDVPRLLPLPGGLRFVALEDVLRTNLARLIGVEAPLDAYLFRVTRSGNLSLDSENIEDIVDTIAENVALRPFQPAVRIEVEERMPEEHRDFLVEHLQMEARSRLSPLSQADVYTTRGPIDLERLKVIGELPIDELRYPPRKRLSPLSRARPLFDQLRERDVLVRFPRHSFERSVERLIQEASVDPDVEALRVTLYRTSKASRIVRLLRKAHRNGKAVTALIELKASFDERRNIEWARTLESAGIRVLYGPPSLKVHAKMASVLRREGDSVRVYSYIGTGNLNATTAAAYTDIGLLTADQELGLELEALFATLAGRREPFEYRKLLVAPFNMRDGFLRLIEREIENARAGKSARITAKLNGIADKEIVSALYRASDAGVEIDLLVRGMCAVRAGVVGLSERIRVVAVAGRYLEHSRIFRFDNAGQAEYFIGSADWRGRNLTRRVEVVTPIRDEELQQRLDRTLNSNLTRADAWDLLPDGRYVRRKPVGEGNTPTPGLSALAGVD